MTITELCAQLEREAAISRRALERVPEGRPGWKPHEKSMAFGYLATLVATMPAWVAMIVGQDSLDLNPPWVHGAGHQHNRELLAAHDDSVAKGRDARRSTNGQHLMTTWRLRVAGRVVAEDPPHLTIADTFTHLAHHLGQPSVYLRLNGAPVPVLNGPSADDRR